MSNSVVITYTGRGLPQLLNDGGSKAWSLDAKRVSTKIAYLICVQNRKTGKDWAHPTADHQHAFLIGKVSGVKLIRKRQDGKPARWSVQISEYAELDIPDMWNGARNPVSYTSLAELDIDEKSLKFKAMPEIEDKDTSETLEEYHLEKEDDTEEEGITIKEAKRLLAIKYDTSIEDIKITISA